MTPTRAVIAAAFVASAMPASADDVAVHEREMVARLCAGFAIEENVPDVGRADCVGFGLAIEVDWADKWKEGVGQALAYAAGLGLRPGVVLVCRKSEALCLKHTLAAQDTFSAAGIAATVWNCAIDSPDLDDCRQQDIDP